jgi:Domain of Unknown Function (DUF1080)
MINRAWLLLGCTGICMLAVTSFTTSHFQKATPLFDGRSFRGWEGDTVKTWRIEDGSIVGGSLKETVPLNNFLCTRRSYSNFILRLKFKLIGNSGFVNAGVQFRSQRLTDPAHEMIGYQADIGPKYWGSLYDESRRNKTLVLPDSVTMDRLVRKNDWNDFEIRCDNRHIKIYLNGEQTVDYIESDQSLPQSGLIGLQIHGGGKAEVYYKDLMLTESK